MAIDWKEAVRIDFSSRVTMKDRLSEKKMEIFAAAAADEDEEAFLELLTDDEDVIEQLKIEFILQLCTAQLSCGQCTVDAEDRANNVAISLGLPSPTLDLGPRVMHASFSKKTASISGRGHANSKSHSSDNNVTFLLSTKRDIVLYKLQDVTELAILVATDGNGSKYSRQDMEACLYLLEDVMAGSSPFGWLIQDFFYVALSTLATIAAFFGSYPDCVVTFIIAMCVLGVQKLRNKYPTVLVPLEYVLVSSLVAVLAAGSYRIADYLGFEEIYGQGSGNGKACNLPIIYLSPLLVYLPGSDLIYGAYEVQMGHIVVGASRLVSAFVKCMVMASGLTIGWQLTGYDVMKGYPIGDGVNDILSGGLDSSFVPTGMCAPFSQPWNIQPWWVIFGGWNVVLLLPVLGGLQVRPRNMLSNFIIAYISLMVFGATNFAGKSGGGVGISSALKNILGLFIATNLACIKEYMTGIPAVSGIVPVLLVLAPGSTVVLDILTLMQVDANVAGANVRSSDIVTNLWFLGVTYALGMYIALALWKPLLLKSGVSNRILEQVKLQNTNRRTQVIKMGEKKPLLKKF